MIVAVAGRPGFIVPGLFLKHGPGTGAGTALREATIPVRMPGASTRQPALRRLSIRSWKLKAMAQIHPNSPAAVAAAGSGLVSSRRTAVVVAPVRGHDLAGVGCPG
jgi:hypothetical protein